MSEGVIKSWIITFLGDFAWKLVMNGKYAHHTWYRLRLEDYALVPISIVVHTHIGPRKSHWGRSEGLMDIIDEEKPTSVYKPSVISSTGASLGLGAFRGPLSNSTSARGRKERPGVKNKGNVSIITKGMYYLDIVEIGNRSQVESVVLFVLCIMRYGWYSVKCIIWATQRNVPILNDCRTRYVRKVQVAFIRYVKTKESIKI